MLYARGGFHTIPSFLQTLPSRVEMIGLPWNNFGTASYSSSPHLRKCVIGNYAGWLALRALFPSVSSRFIELLLSSYGNSLVRWLAGSHDPFPITWSTTVRQTPALPSHELLGLRCGRPSKTPVTTVGGSTSTSSAVTTTSSAVAGGGTTSMKMENV